MYYEHFGLDGAPFKITPDTQLFYSGGRRGLVLDALIYAISQGDGIVKVVGEVGSGKTMLCRMLPEKLPDNIEVIYLANPSLTPDTILQAIALEMKLECKSQDKLEVMQAIHASLLEKHSAGKHVVALVEEAQGMPLETLEEIRLLSNLETTQHKLLQMVLFGQPELDTNLSAEHIRQLKERITHSFELAPLNREEVAEYVDFRLRAVGYKGPPLFSIGALKLLAKNSQGLLRRINILADKALLAVFSDAQHQVQPQHMQRAIKDSGFLNYHHRQSSNLVWLGTLAIIVALFLAALFVWQAQLDSEAVTPKPPDVTATAAPPETTETAQSNPLQASLMAAPSAPKPEPEVTDASDAEASRQKATVLAKAEKEKNPATFSIPPVQQRLRMTQDWLKHADKNRYTLQVMELDSDSTDAIEDFLDKENIRADSVYIFRYPRRNTLRWLLLHGEYDDYKSAQGAIAGLPEALQRNQPFIRKLSSLQEKLRIE